MLTFVMLGISKTFDALEFSHQLFDMLGGAMPCHLQQMRLVLWRGRARHRADLGTGDDAGAERSIDLRQRRQTFCYYFLARSAEVDSAVVVQPVRWRLHPGIAQPGFTLDARSEQFEETVLCGVDVARETGDRLAEFLVVFGDGKSANRLCGGL